MKILYFDVETTGRDPKVNEIIQFSAIVEIDGEVKETVNWYCQPTRWENVEPEALEVTGKTIEELQTYPPASALMDGLESLFNEYIDKYDKTDKFYPAGHNVGFDLDFLQAFWKQHGDKYGTGSYQNWRSLDSRVLAHFLITAGKIPEPENIKLSTLCAQFDIPINAHDAMSDITATRELIKKMLTYLK